MLGVCLSGGGALDSFHACHAVRTLHCCTAADSCWRQGLSTVRHLLHRCLPAAAAHTPQVDLGAATSKARARSMQQIKAEKLGRAQAYHRALAERASLPRFLRLLDLRLTGALADMAAASVAEAAGALRAAAPALRVGGDAADNRGAGDSRAGSEDSEAAGTEAGEGASESGEQSVSPAFLVSLVFEDSDGSGGGIGLCPSEAEWAAALEADSVDSSLRLAGTIQPLLSLPAFERYQAQLLAAASEEQEGQQPGEQQQQQQGQQERMGAAELAQVDIVFEGAAAELRALLRRSFAEARQVAQRYQRYQAIQRFGRDFDFDAWATQQRWAVVWQ